MVVVLAGGRLTRHVAPLLAVLCLASAAWWVHLGVVDPEAAQVVVVP